MQASEKLRKELQVTQNYALNSGRRNSLFLLRFSLFVLFRPSTDWMRPTHNRESHLVYCLLIQMLISSRNTLTAMARVMFDQMSGYSWPSQVDT